VNLEVCPPMERVVSFVAEAIVAGEIWRDRVRVLSVAKILDYADEILPQLQAGAELEIAS
jgi:hypothetical protein